MPKTKVKGLYRRKDSPLWSYDFQVRGHRFCGETDTANRREAERIVEAERKHAKDALAAAGRAAGNQPMTIEVAFSRYWLEVGQHHVNADTTEAELAWLQEHFGKKTSLDAITDADIAAMVARRRGEVIARKSRDRTTPLPRVSNATVNRGTTVRLRAIMTRARDTWGVPVRAIRWRSHMLPEPKERIREASVAEEVKIMEAARGDYAPAIRFAILSGCRRAEIVGLRWAHVDFINRQFTVTGKGDKSRLVPMSAAIFELLWSLKDHHPDAVFTYVCQRADKATKRARGERYPITMEGFKTEWRRAIARAGVENLRFHDTRHTAATRLLRASGNLRLAQRLLGHENIATTTKYAHVDVEGLRAAMDASSGAQNPAETPETPQGASDNDLKKKKN